MAGDARNLPRIICWIALAISADVPCAQAFGAEAERAPGIMQATNWEPPSSSIYFSAMPADFDAGLPIADANQIAAPVPSIIPMGRRGPQGAAAAESESPMFVGRREMSASPPIYRATELSIPSESYFSSMPSGESDFPPAYPGSLTSFQQAIGPMTAGPAPGFDPGAFESPEAGPSSGFNFGRLGERYASWSTTIEGIALIDGRAPTGPALIARNDGVTTTPVISASDINKAAGLGTRVSLVRSITPATAFQVTHFGIYNWQRHAAATGDNSLQLAGDIALLSQDYINAEVMKVDYVSTINNLEVNLLHSFLSPHRRWVGGFRWINWVENLGIQSTNVDFHSTSNMSVHTTNNLFGGQIGVDHSFLSSIGETQVRMRGGVFANAATQNETINDVGNAFPLVPTVSNQATGVASLGELNFRHSIAPTSNTDICLGYNLLWVQGLARAPAQTDLSLTPLSGTMAMFNNNQAFMHGLSAGATFRW